ncbi:hypothetical protein FHL15_010028 [Xylaria flabelliformis]|uniref:Heterokaryon incompatibility domain-containing protein n=1 Tax=Xylaria flabelliformis TaxID=2512241 RepID=A0A553HME2_9PEZI|nr:hypothetical protein FHL15_010028 [Xylaria flabelliformis]
MDLLDNLGTTTVGPGATQVGDQESSGPYNYDGRRHLKRTASWTHQTQTNHGLHSPTLSSPPETHPASLFSKEQSMRLLHHIPSEKLLRRKHGFAESSGSSVDSYPSVRNIVPATPKATASLTSETTLGLPQSMQEAREHIQRIRAQKLNTYGKDEAGDMEAALKLISGDMYQNPMHFLLEILQNADDSVYEDLEPVMKITYYNGTIRFDTNEVGFWRRDVEAICSVGSSFKQESRQGKRRIGEKGIGFKSVFRIAEAAYITSGYYSFKFTTEESLGMLAPVHPWLRPDIRSYALAFFAPSIPAVCQAVLMFRTFKDSILANRYACNISSFEGFTPKAALGVLLKYQYDPNIAVTGSNKGSDPFALINVFFESSAINGFTNNLAPSSLYLGVPVKKTRVLVSSDLVLPIYSPFPQDTIPGFTSILLQLDSKIDVGQLVEELRTLDGRILMFLQNLKQVLIKIVEADSSVTEIALRQKSQHLTELGGSEICSIEPDDLSPYLFFRHHVQNLPTEQKRKGSHDSEIIIAFPMGLWDSTSLAGSRRPNSVYSFLPVRDYGFEFVLHADFLLVPSREEIDQESEWNRCLRQQIPTAFLHSLTKLRHSRLRYLWPYYVPSKPKIENFFQHVWSETLALLSQSSILESVHGTLVVPSSLSLVPKELADPNGQPLIPAEVSKFTYISASYPVDIRHALESLGVRVLSAEDFLEDLLSFVEGFPEKFQSMPAEWHSCLARVLDPLVNDYEERIMTLPFVQLRDGTLASPKSGLLFAVTADHMTVPEDIHALIVKVDTDEVQSRRILLQKLGAQTLDNASICKIILETHKSADFNPETVQISSLINHTEFLYNAGWSSESPEDRIWLVAEDASRHHGCGLYLSSDDPYSTTQILSRCDDDPSFKKHFPFLNSGYSSRFAKVEDRKWLQKTLGVSEVPRLVCRSHPLATYIVDPGLKLLLNRLHAQDLLQMLKTNWAYYQQWIVPQNPPIAEIPRRPSATMSPVNESQSGEKSLNWDKKDKSDALLRQEIRSIFSELTVGCWDGSAKLSRTCLPRKKVLLDLNIINPKTIDQTRLLSEETSQTPELPETAKRETRNFFQLSTALFPVLDIPEPDDAGWDILKHFGVIVNVTVRELIVRLESLHERAIPSRIIRIYRQIQACASSDDVDFLQRKFKDTKLVYIPEECPVPLPGSRWVSLDACVWDGPTCLKKFPRLRNFYAELEDLFCSKLKLTVANLSTLIAEAKLISSIDSLTYARSLFKQLSHMSYGTYYHTRYDAGFYDLLELEIFPVWKGKRGNQFDHLKSSGMTWYIADVPYLLDSFEGKIPLLAFEPSTLVEMKDLITNLGLVPASKSSRVSIVNQLRSVQILEVESVWVSWKVKNTDGDIFQGNHEKGRAMLAVDDDLLKIYMTKDNMKIGCPPLELIDELAAFCGIDTNEHIRLLSHILIQDDIGRIEVDLDRDSANSKPYSEPNHVGDSLTLLETKADPEARTTSPVPPAQPKSGRQKLEGDWRSKMYGNNVLSEENITKPPKERQISKSEKGEAKRLKNIEKHPRGASDNSKAKKPDSATRRSAYLAVRSKIESSHQDRAISPQGLNRLKKPMNQTPGLISLSVPVLSASRYRQIEEIKFTAELYVAGALAKVMESDFVEHEHWTSYLRSRAGHKPHDDAEDSKFSTFTIPDTNGRLRKYLADKGYANAGSISHDPIFHVQVVHSIGPMGSTFNISSDQVEKTRLLSQAKGATTERTEAFVLAYVYNILDNSEVALYPDPWDLYATGLLSLEVYHDQQGRLDHTAAAVHINFASMHTLTGVGTQNRVFKYTDLKPREIRILDLLPGDDDEPLKGIIKHVTVSQVGRFQALSYVWGGYPSEINPYYLHTRQGSILLNFSLYSALTALRKGSIISVWADGVCINQKNSREKALQINMLGEIFKAADQVTGWLGHAYNGSEDAMRVLSRIRTELHSSSLSESSAESTKVAKRLSGMVPDPSDVTWKYINSLLRRPWFARVWITQELVLPRKVILKCGQSELDWDQFFEALTICERESNRVSRQSPDDIRLLPDAGPAYALGLARHRQNKEGKRYGLLKWFELFEHAEASMEVDKLFAFLGLAHDGDGEEFVPDYESTFEEVIRRYSKGFLLRGQVMELLYRAGGPKSYGFCSWIPRWTVGEFPRTISTWDSHGGPFRAGTPYAPLADTTGGQIPQCLIVDGYVVDVIHSKHPIRWGSGSSLFFFDAMVNFKSLLSFVSEYPTGESRDDLLLQLPIGNAARPHLESHADKERAYRAFAAQEKNEWPSDLRELILSVDNDQDPSKYLHMPHRAQAVVAQYWQTAIAFSKRLGNAILCFTQGRYVGLVPEATVAGDQICLFHGGYVPFVVRKKGPAYTLVGECYIHGIMNGQALQRPGLENQRFILV